MKKNSWIIALTSALVAVALLVVVYMGFNNSLVNAHSQVEEQWANVDTKLQRRHDLIPNLVNVVRGQMKHETDIFNAITSAQNTVSSAKTRQERLTGEADLSVALGRLATVVQTYPELKSNESVARLMDELAGSENRISEEYRKLNKIVKEYNIKVKSFPTSIMAKQLGYEPEPYFQADAGAKSVPVVDLESK